MQTLVVDTSVAVKWIVPAQEAHVAEAELLLGLLSDNQVEVVVPELLKYEMGNVLVKAKRLKPSQLQLALELLYELPLQYVSLDSAMAEKTAKLAQFYDITYYDATFVSLAHEKGAVFVTEDSKLYKKTAQYGCVRLVDFEFTRE